MLDEVDEGWLNRRCGSGGLRRHLRREGRGA